MATMLDVDATREMVTSYYVPETVLQEAAARFLRVSSCFETSLRILHERLRCKQFSVACSKGDLGEVIVSVCMLRAYDCLVPLSINAMCTDAFLTPRTTHAFFRSLLGRRRFAALELEERLPCGYLSFTKWHRVGKQLARICFSKHFAGGVPLFVDRERQGIDLVIPCVKAGEPQRHGKKIPRVSATNLDEAELTGMDMSPIYIQVKNLADPFTDGLITKPLTRLSKQTRVQWPSI
jgi:hypothetical protein